MLVLFQTMSTKYYAISFFLDLLLGRVAGAKLVVRKCRVLCFLASSIAI
jgi:hypothetical protein